MTTAASADDGTPAPRTTQRARRQPVPEAPARDPRQPLLHDHVVVAAAPSVLLCDRSGDVDALAAGQGAQGLFHADIRALSRLRLTVGNEVPDSVLGAAEGAGRARFVGFARNVGDPVPDPSVRVERMREITPGRLEERIVVSSWATMPVTTHLCLEVGADLLHVDRVKFGAIGRPGPARGEPGRLVWAHDDTRVTVEAPGGDLDAAAGTVVWQVDIPPGGRAVLTWRVDVDDVGAPVTPPPAAPTWSQPALRVDDRRLSTLLRRCLADLHGLRMATPESPADVFLAAGAPWFFTLFGRDSLWSARMLLPLGTDLARGTLRVLAARQGRTDDPVSEEEPGKILHEVRRDVLDNGQGLRLPPLYYGSIDATPLWVCLLHDAWRWGMAPKDVEPLLPNLEAALAWLEATTGDGFLAYSRRNASGLANQGWKDSADAIRFRDGHLALGPVSLAEVQGYAHEAALGGAELLEAFGRPEAERWRGYAARLAERFRSAFWVEDDDGPYPAMAIDGVGPARRRRRQQHGSPARHRPARRAGDHARRPATRVARARGRVRPAHDVRAIRRVRALPVPLRHGLAARHGDRRARTRPQRASRDGGRPHRGPALRRRRPPGSAPRAVGRRRPRRGARARPLPGRVPPAGLGGGVVRRRPDDRARSRGRRPRRHARRPARAAVPGGGRPRLGAARRRLVPGRRDGLHRRAGRRPDGRAALPRDLSPARPEPGLSVPVTVTR